jgi:hypothetical protein
MKIYISGPISGIERGNRPAFVLGEEILKSLGHEPVNPHKLGHEPDDDWSTRMRRDIAALVTCDAVALLPGWEDSRGAKIEAGLAETLKMGVYDMATLARGLRGG